MFALEKIDYSNFAGDSYMSGQASLSNIEEHYKEVPEDLASEQWAKATYKSRKRLKAITE